ncbi:hypothetical protein LAZ67_5002752 [Cordylochernes scorpioides]|uniref:Transposase Tc1-like domain-containing protein n=1 Tax=Cordylochernes scorpioides TaxID=51811 RepID=A0ABY6KGP0_9ARAC|nr:hypothetical protein LAZ67_5002752 [Cordylochernes scorpioides]
MMEMTRTDPEWKDNIITGDETWVYGYVLTNQTSICRVERLGKIIVEILFLCQKTRVITENARSSQTEAVQAERRFYEGHGDRTEKGRTISRRLVANGLHSCRPLRRLPLTPPNRRQRLEWCRARSTWMTEWHRVVFSDESRFCLSSDSRRVRVWCRRGERSNPAAIVERPTVRQRGIMVWGAIAYDSRSPLLRIQGTMTAQRYVDDVLRPVTLPYLQGTQCPLSAG